MNPTCLSCSTFANTLCTTLYASCSTVSGLCSLLRYAYCDPVSPCSRHGRSSSQRLHSLPCNQRHILMHGPQMNICDAVRTWRRRRHSLQHTLNVLWRDVRHTWPVKGVDKRQKLTAKSIVRLELSLKYSSPVCPQTLPLFSCRGVFLM
eukprot:2495197-Amphidinium_carterae.1